MASPATDPNARSLYVGNIDPSITDTVLQTTFDTTDTKVIKVKLIKSPGTSAYGFIEFVDHAAAERALQQFAGHKLADRELKVNWANSSPSSYSTQSPHSNNNHSGHREHPGARLGANGMYNVFVGDLDTQVDDGTLKGIFSAYASLEDAKVMLDAEGASRGFGFVMFKEKQDAQNAIVELQGKQLLSRNLRLNWAHPPAYRESRSDSSSTASTASSSNREPRESRQRTHTPAAPLDYNEVVAQTAPSNVTVYVGNLSPEVTGDMLRELFSKYGEIAEVRDHTDMSRVNANGEPSYRAYGFIIFKSHEDAAQAIVGLNGKVLHGKAIKCSWGNEKRPIHNTTGVQLPGFPYGSTPYSTHNIMFYQPPYSLPPNMQGTYQPGITPFNPMWAPWNPQRGWPQNPAMLPPLPTYPAGVTAPSQTGSAQSTGTITLPGNPANVFNPVATQVPPSASNTSVSPTTPTTNGTFAPLP